MAIALHLLNNIETRLQLKILKTVPVQGGNINQVYHLQTSGGDLLLKTNDRYCFPEMFKREKEGLETIAFTKTITVPKVIFQFDIENDSYLLLEWIDIVSNTARSSQLFGEQLAAMHKATAEQFGFESDNYMGSLPQRNRQHINWSDFFVTERLQPMVALAVKKGGLNIRDEQNFEKLYQQMPDLFPEEPPALVHGDLWSGNYLISKRATPYLIDPAVSYSNREVDIAMTTLFGGFDKGFYEAYHSAYPLQPGWQQRLALWNIYPLLVHVNLFGGSYAAQVRQYLRAFV